MQTDPATHATAMATTGRHTGQTNIRQTKTRTGNIHETRHAGIPDGCLRERARGAHGQRWRRKRQPTTIN
eukprot:6072986-Lingulodinium_polyedra.AAC.1